MLFILYYFLANWIFNKSALMWYTYVSIYLFEMCRSISAFVTIVICVVHISMVYLPTKAPGYFTLTRTKILTILAVLIAVVLGLPRFLSFNMRENSYKDVPTLKYLDFIAEPSDFGNLMYVSLKGIHNQIDYWLPPPTILVLVLLTYFKVTLYSLK